MRGIGLAESVSSVIVLLLVGVSVVSGMTVSINRYEAALEEADIRVAEAKKELMKVSIPPSSKAVQIRPRPRPQASDIESLHHQIHQEVGEKRWERDVKPRFLRNLFQESMEDSGNYFPSLQDVMDWSRRSPRQSVNLLEESR